MPRVPTTTEVLPGAFVNIVLKADQPTGRTVQGAVAQLLTRGNHPRGIKVRLTDGRVGRVQSMAGGPAPTGSEAQAGADSYREIAADARPPDVVYGGRRQYRDARTDQEQPTSTQTIGLDAYIKPAKKRGKGKSAGNATAGTAMSDGADQASAEPEQSCPVCGDFRGDAAALMHHVQTHFDD
jgi:uncharacterized repeat protein (TIGR03833 family)